MKNLNLNGIANVIARDTNGYISEDLHLTLIQCSDAGLGKNPYEDTVPFEERKVNYGNENVPMSLEADIILALRFKCGDSKAMEQLYIVNERIINKCTAAELDKRKLSKIDYWDTFKSHIYTAYVECVLDSPLYSDKLGEARCFKTTYLNNFEFYIKSVITKEQVHAKNIAKPVHFFKACNYFRMQMEKANVSICEVTREMVADILGKSASYHYGADTIEEVFNEVHGINMEVSYEALCEADDGELSDTMQDSVLFRSEAVSQNPVEDTLIEKLDTQKKNRILKEICDWESKDREVAIYLMFYVQKMKYREIADKLKLPGGITEAKRLKMRGERKLNRKYPNYEYLDAAAGTQNSNRNCR